MHCGKYLFEYNFAVISPFFVSWGHFVIKSTLSVFPLLDLSDQEMSMHSWVLPFYLPLNTIYQFLLNVLYLTGEILQNFFLFMLSHSVSDHISDNIKYSRLIS